MGFEFSKYNTAIAISEDLSPNRFATFLTDVTVAAGGGAAATHFTLLPNVRYMLELWPDWSGGASFSDVSFGVFREGWSPATEIDGAFIVSGQQIPIGPIPIAGATIYLRTIVSNGVATPASRWRCRRIDA